MRSDGLVGSAARESAKINNGGQHLTEIQNKTISFVHDTKKLTPDQAIFHLRRIRHLLARTQPWSTKNGSLIHGFCSPTDRPSTRSNRLSR